jgi:hypothetical protein
VAAQMMRRLRSALALSALGWLAVMYAVGELPRHGHFNAARDEGGVLTFPPPAVQKMVMNYAGERFEATREGTGWRFRPAPRSTERLTRQIDAALRYLHVSPPVRRLGYPAKADPVLAASGLSPPVGSLVITSGSGERHRFSLGGAAPDRILRYLRDDDSGELYLMSGFVAGAWDEVAKAWKSGPRQAYKR